MLGRVVMSEVSFKSVKREPRIISWWAVGDCKVKVEKRLCVGGRE